MLHTISERIKELKDNPSIISVSQNGGWYESNSPGYRKAKTEQKHSRHRTQSMVSEEEQNNHSMYSHSDLDNKFNNSVLESDFGSPSKVKQNESLKSMEEFDKLYSSMLYGSYKKPKVNSEINKEERDAKIKEIMKSILNISQVEAD